MHGSEKIVSRSYLSQRPTRNAENAEEPASTNKWCWDSGIQLSLSIPSRLQNPNLVVTCKNTSVERRSASFHELFLWESLIYLA